MQNATAGHTYCWIWPACPPSQPFDLVSRELHWLKASPTQSHRPSNVRVVHACMISCNTACMHCVCRPLLQPLCAWRNLGWAGGGGPGGGGGGAPPPMLGVLGFAILAAFEAAHGIYRGAWLVNMHTAHGIMVRPGTHACAQHVASWSRVRMHAAHGSWCHDARRIHKAATKAAITNTTAHMHHGLNLSGVNNITCHHPRP